VTLTGTTTLTVSWWMLGAVAGAVIVVLVVAIHLARPRVTVRLADAVAGATVRTLRGESGDALPLCLRARVARGSWRRGAVDVGLGIHVIAEIHLHLARYGPTNELTVREVKKGKGSSQAVQVAGLTVDRWEPVPYEDVEVWLTVPAGEGKYLAWTTTRAGSGGSGVSRFVFTVKDGTFRLRRVSYLGTWRLRLQRWFASPSPYDLPPFPSLARARW
jgi:hypothetical protein